MFHMPELKLGIRTKKNEWDEGDGGDNETWKFFFLR